jgi:hypothetical protein
MMGALAGLLPDVLVRLHGVSDAALQLLVLYVTSMGYSPLIPTSSHGEIPLVACSYHALHVRRVVIDSKSEVPRRVVETAQGSGGADVSAVQMTLRSLRGLRWTANKLRGY